MNRSPVLALIAASILSLSAVAAPPGGAAQQVGSNDLAQLPVRHIGPVGNRISAVYGVTTQPLVDYAGAASGGLWKTVDGGLWWEPLFEDQNVHSIGSIAVSELDPEIVWVGTGEPHIRSNVTIGDGVYKSLDGGQERPQALNQGQRREGIDFKNLPQVVQPVRGQGWHGQWAQGRSIVNQDI